MKNKIDELFKGKLEHHATSPSAEAWAKIEDRLPKKNKIIFVWKIAAAFALFGIAIVALYWLQSNNDEMGETELANKKIELPNQAIEKKTTAPSIAKSEIKQKENSDSKNDIIKSIQPITKIESKKEETLNVVETPKVEEKNELIAEINTQVTKVEPVTTVKREKPIVLEFTLLPIERPTIAQAEDENEGKITGLKKAFAFAKDLKNGESSIDLSNLKENFFAHNTKKDKSRNNQ
jgi:hypothetical protein